MTEQPAVEPPLAGYTVVELSTGIAGAYCTKLLADGGADVIKVEPPEGDPLRSWSASGAVIDPGADGALFSFLNGGKHSVVADPASAADPDLVETLLASADAVVWSAGSAVAARFRPEEMHHRHRHLVVTSITPFGLEGPWRDRPATEFTLQAWSGGIVGLGRGVPDRAPVFVGGQVGEYLAGAYASAATLASRYRQIDSGTGELIDLSMLESQILGLTYYPVTYFEMLGRPWRDARKLTVPGWRRRVTDWWTSDVEPRSSGSTCVRWSAARSGSTRTHRCPSPNRPTSTPTRSMRGCAVAPSTKSGNSRQRSAFPTRRWPTARTSGRWTTSGSVVAS
ncbi:hypothetical protein NIIDMKKI_07820 [Mycobacterium kansasii]|uniref:CoA-transferase III family protein n=1 Tax=Mycobacterium kansasii TaxID=1768 RepID=A0A7G1I3J4_MYCKA|nr:hypothetical protein NIIDMKKI_07820 [Mycobacterium kansasii]